MTGAARPAEEICRSLYGAPDGTWALLESPLGTIPPPTIAVSRGMPARTVYLPRLGSPTDVIRQVYEQLKVHPRAGAQEAIAQLLGVKQQTVSRYVAGALPETPLAGWSGLVRAFLGGPRG